MRVLGLELPGQTASKLQEAAERLSVSREPLLILSVEEKRARVENEFRRSAKIRAPEECRPLSAACLMRYVSLQEVISLHSLLVAQSGGSAGLRDRHAFESAVVQPQANFGCNQLSPDLASKAVALAHSLNSRSSVDVAHAMEVFHSYLNAWTAWVQTVSVV